MGYSAQRVAPSESTMSPAKQPWDVPGTVLRVMATATPPLVFYLVYSFEKYFYEAARINNYPLSLGRFAERPLDALAFSDLAARIGFHGAGTAFALAWVVALGVPLLVLVRAAPTERGYGAGFLGFWSVCAAGLGGWLGQGSREDPLSIPPLMPPFEHLAGPAVDAELRLRGFVELFGGFTALSLAAAGALTVCAMGLLWRVAAPFPGSPAAEESAWIGARARDARMLLYAGAGVLVTAVLLSGACHRLPLPYLEEAVRSGYRQAADAERLLTGTIWSFYLVGIYVPASLMIHRRARRLARHALGSEEPAETRAFLEKLGVGAGPVRGLKDLLALLGPLLAGSPALDLLGSFIG